MILICNLFLVITVGVLFLDIPKKFWHLSGVSFFLLRDIWDLFKAKGNLSAIDISPSFGFSQLSKLFVLDIVFLGGKLFKTP